MDEQERLRDLQSYPIFDSTLDKELDELVKIASAICDTPISLLSIVDDKRQWFKINNGLNVSETLREHSFCQHALHKPKEVLVVDNPLDDHRFRKNPLVLNDPYIRFYAGAPLETIEGNVLGTLCVIDNKPRKISERQKSALQLIAKKVMDHLEMKKILLAQGNQLEKKDLKLHKLTNYAPGALFQLEMKKDGTMFFPFLSNGFSKIHPELDMEVLKTDATICFGVVHPDDVAPLEKSLQKSFSTLEPWNEEYRVVGEGDAISWHWANAQPERKEDGAVVWHGTFQDITERKEYINMLEQILFDISHVVRKPVANIMGITSIIENHGLEPEEMKDYLTHLKTASEEMDQC